MSTRSHSPAIALAVVALLCAGATEGQEKEAFFLPQDDELYDDISVRGTSERKLRRGLSRLSVPDSDTTYYVIDERDALHGDLFEAFADIWRNDSDISIGYDQLRSEFIHFRVRPDTRDVRYIKVEPALLFQTSEFVRDGGFSNASRSVEFLEYEIPGVDCPNIGGAIAQMQALLQDAVSTIGPPQEPVNTIVMDGIGYGLRVRLGRLEGSFGVGENNGPLFDVVHSVMTLVRECAMGLEPEARTHEFD